MFDDLRPSRTALVVIDLQNAFLTREYAVSFAPAALEILPRVNEIATELRSAGGRVYWVKNTVDESNLADWPTWFGMFSGRQLEALKTHLRPGTPGHDLYHGLDVRQGDQIVLKRRYSAFMDGASDLTSQLRSAGIDTVVIVGAVTHVCCDSSARDAMMKNFRTVMISDANAGLTEAEQVAALASFYSSFGDVMTTAEVVSFIRANRLAETGVTVRP
jgi:ureidoacrylate peracid hydrolase